MSAFWQGFEKRAMYIPPGTKRSPQFSVEQTARDFEEGAEHRSKKEPPRKVNSMANLALRTGALGGSLGGIGGLLSGGMRGAVAPAIGGAAVGSLLGAGLGLADANAAKRPIDEAKRIMALPEQQRKEHFRNMAREDLRGLRDRMRSGKTKQLFEDDLEQLEALNL